MATEYIGLFVIIFLFGWLAVGSFAMQYARYKMLTGNDAPSLVWARRKYKRLVNDIVRPFKRVM